MRFTEFLPQCGLLKSVGTPLCGANRGQEAAPAGSIAMYPESSPGCPVRPGLEQFGTRLVFTASVTHRYEQSLTPGCLPVRDAPQAVCLTSIEAVFLGYHNDTFFRDLEAFAVALWINTDRFPGRNDHALVDNAMFDLGTFTNRHIIE